MTEPTHARYSGEPVTATVQRVGLSIAEVAAAGYRADHKRCARIAKDMEEVGAHGLAAEFRQFAFIALRASRAERR